jgi:hypothetical protein
VRQQLAPAQGAAREGFSSSVVLDSKTAHPRVVGVPARRVNTGAELLQPLSRAAHGEHAALDAAFVLIQLLALVLLALFPELVTWLPAVIFGG